MLCPTRCPSSTVPRRRLRPERRPRLSHHMTFAATAAAMVLAAGTAAAQPPPGPPRSGPGYPQVYDPNMPFDPKEVAGIWTPNAVGFGGGGRCRDCGDRGFSHEFPVFTPRSEERRVGKEC